MKVILPVAYLLIFKRPLILFITTSCQKKLDYYGVRGVSNKWFESCLTDWKQFVLINGFSSNISTITSGDPQGSVLEPLLFLIYIKDPNLAIKHCKVHLLLMTKIY